MITCITIRFARYRVCCFATWRQPEFIDAFAIRAEKPSVSAWVAPAARNASRSWLSFNLPITPRNHRAMVAQRPKRRALILPE